VRGIPAAAPGNQPGDQAQEVRAARLTARASALQAEDEGSTPSPPTVVVAELEALPYSAGL
jgi:hypothetical protein